MSKDNYYFLSHDLYRKAKRSAGKVAGKAAEEDVAARVAGNLNCKPQARLSLSVLADQEPLVNPKSVDRVARQIWREAEIQLMVESVNINAGCQMPSTLFDRPSPEKIKLRYCALVEQYFLKS